MPPDRNLQYEGLPLLLFGRDSCSDAFGSNASNSICTPSLTLCCVRRGQQYPSCQQYLDKGWCCIGNTPDDNCYVDQASACDEPNSVPCTNLAEGTSEACCPRLTSCDTGTKARKDYVRCNIRYSDLRQAAAGVEQSSSSSSSSSSLVSVVSSVSGAPGGAATASSVDSSDAVITTTALSGTVDLISSTTGGEAAAQTAAGNVDSQGQAGSSPGLIAGAAVGATLGLVALVVLGYLFLRKRLKMRQEGGVYPSGSYPHAHDPHPQPPVVAQPPYAYPDYAQLKRDAAPVGYGFPGQWNGPAELMAKGIVNGYGPAELPAGR